LRSLWADGLFSFDASGLLNIYGYSSETREQLVDFIERNAGRVRLAHQFGLESHNRASSHAPSADFKDSLKQQADPVWRAHSCPRRLTTATTATTGKGTNRLRS